jgi:2-dehydropantoate 2-reductase
MSMIHKPCVILVAGIGGVGGYYGGMLAKHYQDSEKVHIRFLARGNHAAHIQNEGLLVQTSEERFRTHPERCSSDANALGIADYILICC